MKRNRNSISYRIGHWFHVRGWEELGKLIFEIVTALAFFGMLLLLPHLLH